MNLAIALLLASSIGGVRSWLLHEHSKEPAVLRMTQLFGLVAVASLLAILLLLVVG